LFNILKGWLGEATVSIAQWILLDKNIYKALNNITIQTSNGTTQIDHVIVSKFGIFVVETKNMTGWIFGGEKQATWTQSLPGGRKHSFQSPLRQNHRHIKALEEFLGIDYNMFHSMVMFIGESKFKTEIPSNVMDHGYLPYIKSKTEIFFTDQEVNRIVSALQSGRLEKSFATRRQHIDSLKERHASTSICPKCGSELVLRTAKKGINQGRQFYGCSGFPKCRYMKGA
jgi:restriction system protein